MGSNVEERIKWEWDQRGGARHRIPEFVASGALYKY